MEKSTYGREILNLSSAPSEPRDRYSHSARLRVRNPATRQSATTMVKAPTATIIATIGALVRMNSKTMLVTFASWRLRFALDFQRQRSLQQCDCMRPIAHHPLRRAVPTRLGGRALCL